MLHIAPEPCFEPIFKRIEYIDYITADLRNLKAMVRMDITNIKFPDNSFDVIYCSHVLEHIHNDQIAIAELYRVCKPGSWALLNVPIMADQTFEDKSIVTSEERKKIFGQADHVRRCGLDYVDRIKQAGFKVTKFFASDIIESTDSLTLGIPLGQKIFFVEKII